MKEPEKPKPAFPVKMEVHPDKREGDSKQRIVVTLIIEKGYHLLANPSGNEDLPSITVLTVQSKGQPDVVQVTYPRGEVVKDNIVGDYRIYTGTIKLEALVRRAKGDNQPLSVAVRVRPMDQRGCLWGIRLLSSEVP